MTMQINKSTKLVGYLVFWTIPTLSAIDVKKLNTDAITLGCPYPIGGIKPRDSKSAWKNATQIGARGIVSAKMQTDDDETESVYLVKNAGGDVRLLIRETVNAAHEVVDTETVASLYHAKSGFEYAIQPALRLDAEKHQEVLNIIDGMENEYQAFLGSVGDDRIRSALSSWLVTRHRVTVRGSGGVYFIPRPSSDNEASVLEDELDSVRQWVNSFSGTFSIVEMNKSGLNTHKDILNAGINEVKDELEQINGRLKKWSNNPKMNAGSRAISAEMVSESIEKLGKQIQALEAAFGEELETITSMLQTVERKREKLREASELEIKTKKV